MIPIPKRLRILDKSFSVRLIANLKIRAGDFTPTTYSGEWVHEHDEAPEVLVDVLGATDSDAQYIRIESESGPETIRQTFVHETLHALLAGIGIRDQLNMEQEEALVKRLAPALVLFIRQNPKALAYIRGGWYL